MYGIVNKAIEELVRETFGDETWEKVRKGADIDIDFFLSNESYDDDVTYKLAASCADVTGLSLGEVLQAFGEWWVLKTGRGKYGNLMQAGGTSLGEFLMHLPLLHSRVMLIYPKLSPPEFRVTQISPSAYYVHYFSKRVGLKEFVRGLLSGLAKMYNTPSDIQLVEDRDQGSDHEVFKVSW